MDWTVNDNLHNRFLKCKLNCENILEFELAMLAEIRKCKKVIAWSGDFLYRPVCILVSTSRRNVLGCHLEQI